MDASTAINEAARELRNQADRDYICARHLYALGFADQFMWQAQQALEKYPKAAILFNWPLPHEGGTLPGRLDGRKRKSDNLAGYGHDLPKLLADLIGIEPWHPEIPPRVRKYAEHITRMGLNRLGDRHAHAGGPCQARHGEICGD